MSSATSVKQSSGTQVTTANQGNELTTIQIPPAFAVASDDLPFVDDWLGIKGVRLKLLMADIEGGRFTVQIRFAPGLQMPPHKHTGEVHAYTLEGNGTTSNTTAKRGVKRARISTSRRVALTRSRSPITMPGKPTWCLSFAELSFTWTKLALSQKSAMLKATYVTMPKPYVLWVAAPKSAPFPLAVA
jgi:hypothetical protein